MIFFEQALNESGGRDQMQRHTTRPKTLSRAFINKLIIIVSIIFCVTSLLSVWLYSHEATRAGKEKHSEYLEYLSSNLKLPLWNIDSDWVESICNSFAKNEIVSLLKVTTEDGDIIFSMINEDEPSLIVDRQPVFYNEFKVGSVELGFTKRIHQKSNLQMFSRSILPMLFVILGLIVSSKILLGRLVEKPLNHLITRMEKISAGNYQEQESSFNHYEITKILEKFNSMAKEVNKRERSLVEANLQLESEIADRKEAEKAHRESEKRYRQLVEELPVGIFRASTEPNGTYDMVNPAFAKMLGYDSGEAVLQKSAKQVYKEPEMRKNFLEMLFQDETIQGLSLEMKKKDGEPIDVLVSAHVVKDKQGRPVYVDGIIEDVSERNNLERQIRRAQKMEAIGTLAGGIAHDFNNILASIFGFTEAAKMRHAQGRRIEHYFDEILEAGLRARSLIKQMLAFSRQTEVKRGATFVGPIIKETIKFLRASLPAMIEIKRQFNVGDCVVWADSTQIHQILMNLCTNAAHAMQIQGGKLKIVLDEVELDGAQSYRIRDLVPGPYACISVIDDGHGIQPEFIDKIFDPFFTTKPRGEGTGMGLAVIHGIVSDMGGGITVASTPGQGASFEVYLPVHASDSGTTDARNLTPNQGSGKILFVDDEEGFLLTGKEILEGLGYEVITASSGERSLAIFDENPYIFDLVITDLAMAKMTGLKLAEKLRERRGDIPVILCTGFSAGIDQNTQEHTGISEIVMKPLLAKELTDAIQKALKLKD